MTLEQALRLHAVGLGIIPLKPRAKQPDLPSWEPYQAARATRAEVEAWFGNGVRRNAGITLGPVSQVVAIDCDTDAAEQWCATHLPPTPMMTRTARGTHRFYRLPSGAWADAELPAVIKASDTLTIEVKRHGQYVVAPGSVHPDGHLYAEVQPWPSSLDGVPEFPMADIARLEVGAQAGRTHAAPLPGTVEHGTRNNTLFVEGCRLRGRGYGKAAILSALTALNMERCHPPLDARELESIAESCAKYEPAPDTHPRTDTGNAEFFGAMFGDRVRYDHSRRQWAVFDGHHWLFDRTEQVDRFALDAIRARQAAALKITDDDKRKQHQKWALDSENRPRRDNLARLAAKLPQLAVSGDDWDTNRWLLGVQNGVIDLQTGRLRDGSPNDHVTKVAPVSFDAAARCPRWDRFMREIFADQPDLADYMQRVLGYALTGITSEQVFWILWGTGANGKSTLMEVVMRAVLGEAYTWTMPFPAAGWSNAMSEYQKASLVGQRLVAANEVTRRGELNEELIKSLTGDDTVNARHPYGRPFQFVPVAKFFLRVNDKPVIRDQSHGMWRRVKLVPFTQTFGSNSTLAGTLMAEAPGILAWAVRGCVDWQRNGLRHPEAVEAATKEYQSESDPITEFIADRCVVAPNAKVGGKALFDAYQSWCIERQLEDVDRLSQKAFGTRIRQRFSAIDGRTVTYVGIGLVSREHAEENGGPRI